MRDSTFFVTLHFYILFVVGIKDKCMLLFPEEEYENKLTLNV